MAQPLILKRAPIGDNLDDYSVLERRHCRPHLLSLTLSARRAAHGCGRAVTTAKSAAPLTATSRRARLRRRRLPRAGGASEARTSAGVAIVVAFTPYAACTLASWMCGLVLLRPARILVLTLIHKTGGAHREGVPWRKRLYSIDKKS
jgi:hypothetical protein